MQRTERSKVKVDAQTQVREQQRKNLVLSRLMWR